MEKQVKQSLQEIVTKLTRSQIFIIVLFIITLWFVGYQILPYFERQRTAEKRLTEQITVAVIKEQLKNKKTLDSIKLIEQNKKHKQTFKNIDKIYDIMSYARKIIPSASTIAVYYLHDSGGVPISGSPLNITVLYEASDKDIMNLKKDWQSQPLPEGYFHYNKFIYDRGHKYVNDVRNYKKVYHGETKEYLKKYHCMSLYGVLLEQSTGGTYYLSIGFPKVNPIDEGGTIVGNINRIASEIRPLLQVREAPLNN